MVELRDWADCLGVIWPIEFLSRQAVGSVDAGRASGAAGAIEAVGPFEAIDVVERLGSLWRLVTGGGPLPIVAILHTSSQLE